MATISKVVAFVRLNIKTSPLKTIKNSHPLYIYASKYDFPAYFLIFGI
jgi:hypothetical protein